MYRMTGNHWKYHASNYGQMNLMNELRKLWMEQVIWTRLFMISAAAELPDLEVIKNRMQRNPSGFANLFEIFYGKQSAETFRNLLEEHLKIAGYVVEAANQGNEKAAEQFSKIWHSNAEQIAAFLASTNPCWSEEEWKNLMYDHLRMNRDMAVARIKGDYLKDSTIFEMLEEQVLAIADIMTAGIIKQFDI